MKKETYANNLSYIFNAERYGAKYSIDGGNKWMNHGDYCECLAKSVLGFEPKKDANTRSDKDHDIREINASVKSWKCGISDRKDLKAIGNREEFLYQFFHDEIPNTTYIWVNDYDEFVDLYYMNMEEFKKFVDVCASWDNYEQKIRFTKSINTIISYLEKELDK